MYRWMYIYTHIHITYPYTYGFIYTSSYYNVFIVLIPITGKDFILMSFHCRHRLLLCCGDGGGDGGGCGGGGGSGGKGRRRGGRRGGGEYIRK